MLPSTVDRVPVHLLQHALQRWCPPLIVFRRRGVQTASEIDYERNALKAIRGDFEHLTSQSVFSNLRLASQAFDAARA